MTITINGSGTISGITAGGLPDATITQADLAANVAGNGPAFSAWASSTTAVPNLTNTKLLFATEEFDTNNNFASSRFTPTVAGYYQINASAYSGNGTGAAEILLYVNGFQSKGGPLTPAVNSIGAVVGASILLYLNGSTDYVEVYLFQNSGTSSTVNSGQNYTFFQGYLARSAT